MGMRWPIRPTDEIVGVSSCYAQIFDPAMELSFNFLSDVIGDNSNARALPP
jgi:hypothetical protein